LQAPKKAVNVGSLIFGAVMLLVGLSAYFYELRYYYNTYGDYTSSYPYQALGIILTLTGIAFIGLGLFYKSKS
jgi:hypothetical protein